MKRKLRRAGRNALDFTKTSMVLGVSTSAVAGIGGSTAGLSTLSSSMPLVGSAMGGGMALDALGSLSKRRRRR